MTPRRLVESVLEATRRWQFDAISIGYPGLVDAFTRAFVIDYVVLGGAMRNC